MRTCMHARAAMALGLLVGLSCGTPAPRAPPELEPRISAVAIAEQAGRLCEQAREVEPSITPVLAALAQSYGATLAKLDNRLKSPASTARKLHKELVDSPNKRLSDVVLSDLVRYTLVVADAPPGHYAQMIRAVIAALEGQGHELRKLKNYWRPGDHYSGVNSVFMHPSGLLWELQFHTPSSLAASAKTHELYERLRSTGTPLREKQELYRRMAAAWDEVEIPSGMLQGSLHGKEVVIQLPPP